jgi:hypothetical protein
MAREGRAKKLAAKTAAWVKGTAPVAAEKPKAAKAARGGKGAKKAP